MSTATKGKRPMRHLTASDKIDAIQRIHDGESKASVARDIGVPESTLRGWCKNEDKLRYMSRQSTPDGKLDKFTEDAVAAGLLGQLGPPEKRMKLDTSLPLNFTTNGNAYKGRHSLNGLDLSNSGEMNGLSHSDFSAFAKSGDLSLLHSSNKLKNSNMKGYGADLSKPADPTKGDMSMAAISPLTSLSHLSGMSSLGPSPLALSFNEIATNLNLIAQFNNPNLAAMSGLNSLNSSPQSLRNVRPQGKTGNNNMSPRSNSDHDKLNQGLTVKNLSKLQKNDLMGLNLSDKSKKMSSPSSMPTINRDAPVDDALWYWLKSQQAMLGLNSLYSTMANQNQVPTSASSPQLQNSTQHIPAPHTPVQPSTRTVTPPVVSSPQVTPPSSTPSAASDDTKNSSWFWQWYKTFGSSLLDKQNTINNNGKISSSAYENILYSQLTKGAAAAAAAAANSDNLNNNNNTPKPEDLSQHNHHHHNDEVDVDIDNDRKHSINDDEVNDNDDSYNHCVNSDDMPNDLSTSIKIEETCVNISSDDAEKSSGKVRAVLDDLLYNNNNNNSDNNNQNTVNNNNNNHIKNEPAEASDAEISSSSEAVEHGEKFLKWLESYSDPSVTAMQVMQFKYLLNTIKTSADRASQPQTYSGEERIKIRRRK